MFGLGCRSDWYELLFLAARILFNSEIKTRSSICKSELHSLTKTEALIPSGILAILSTTSRIIPARFIGSFPASFSRILVLKSIKSFLLSSTWVLNAALPNFCTKESGSSPSGKSTTLTFKPSSRIISSPLKDALMPASSPS